ncbi:E3 ubiquitin-protein ligase RNF14-like [Oratosquilla oratoria]|uniref:E3 ubiquitin-protein ligase RNF14-like n=1 Tax=Oratosquilla oratoria TaxID=337810 RepID=UPI003F75D9E1
MIMAADLEAQEDELMALASIYEETFTESRGTGDDSGQLEGAVGGLEKKKFKGGELAVHLDLPSNFTLTNCSRNEDVDGEKIQKVEHLPPLYLHFSLPSDYPSHSSPEFTLSCKWLSRTQLSKLCSELDAIWEEYKGSVVLFMWAQCLKDNTLMLLDIEDTLDLEKVKPHVAVIHKQTRVDTVESTDTHENMKCQDNGVKNDFTNDLDKRTVQDLAPDANLLRILKEYDSEMTRQVFASKMFECKVCFGDKLGSQCIQFWPCSHVYCKDCMKSYFEVQINEGNIKCLKCPEDKCESDANPVQVQNLVPEDLYKKWDEMLLSSTLSSLGDIMPCPRKHCQYPVTIDDHRGQCPSCDFVFCALCSCSWHGLEPCRLRGTEARQILATYVSGDQSIRQSLEDRYGKKYLRSLENDYLTLEYLKDNSKNCPHCRAPVEKKDGCNKMTCFRCNAYFCWICMNLLDKTRPYSHYDNPKSPCFERLFQGTELEDDFDFFE